MQRPSSDKLKFLPIYKAILSDLYISPWVSLGNIWYGIKHEAEELWDVIKEFSFEFLRLIVFILVFITGPVSGAGIAWLVLQENLKFHAKRQQEGDRDE